MKTSNGGLGIIKKHEGLRLRAYFCPAGVPTIGWGHTGTVTAEDVRRGFTISEEAAERLLRADLTTAEKAINDLVRVPLAQHEFDALASFVFNVGRRAFEGSTLLRVLNRGHKAQVPEQLARWKYAKRQVLPGLVARRAEEGALWAHRQDENATPDNVDSAGAKLRRMVGLV